MDLIEDLDPEKARRIVRQDWDGYESAAESCGTDWAERELAEAEFREAIALAQKMSAKAWELRAATGLPRMLQARRDRAAAGTSSPRSTTGSKRAPTRVI